MSPPTVWDQKCESVNVTVPQRECNTVEEAKVEMDCEVLEETSSTPVCICWYRWPHWLYLPAFKIFKNLKFRNFCTWLLFSSNRVWQPGVYDHFGQEHWGRLRGSGDVATVLRLLLQVCDIISKCDCFKLDRLGVEMEKGFLNYTWSLLCQYSFSNKIIINDTMQEPDHSRDDSKVHIWGWGALWGEQK